MPEPGPDQCMGKPRAAHDTATREVAKVATTWKYRRVIELARAKVRWQATYNPLTIRLLPVSDRLKGNATVNALRDFLGELDSSRVLARIQRAMERTLNGWSDGVSRGGTSEAGRASSWLRAGQVHLPLGPEHIAMQVCYPLPSARRDI